MMMKVMMMMMMASSTTCQTVVDLLGSLALVCAPHTRSISQQQDKAAMLASSGNKGYQVPDGFDLVATSRAQVSTSDLHTSSGKELWLIRLPAGVKLTSLDGMQLQLPTRTALTAGEDKQGSASTADIGKDIAAVQPASTVGSFDDRRGCRYDLVNAPLPGATGSSYAGVIARSSSLSDGSSSAVSAGAASSSGFSARPFAGILAVQRSIVVPDIDMQAVKAASKFKPRQQEHSLDGVWVPLGAADQAPTARASNMAASRKRKAASVERDESAADSSTAVGSEASQKRKKKKKKLASKSSKA